MKRTGPFGVALVVAACGGRPDFYEAQLSPVRAFGLEAQVALVDDGAHRVVSLVPGADQEISVSRVAVGKAIVKAEASTDGKRLFVLSAGDLTRKKGSDEAPSLTVLEGSQARRYALGSPHSAFAVDPLGRWVVLFAAPATSTSTARLTFVENPNEIVVVDLTAPEGAAVTERTLRSFGGFPQRISFTPPLTLPGGSRRLLVVETEKDVALLDLDNLRTVPSRPEITVRLSSGSTALQSRPAGVVVDDGEPGRSDDARIGIRLENGTSVVTLTLVPNLPTAKAEDPGQVPNDFRPLVNLTDVGGVPGDMAFVRTEAGLRLAAIVPQTRQAVLIDPETSITTKVELPEPYGKISLITSAIGGGGIDTALLYAVGGPASVAVWSLGRASGQPYRSVDVVSLPSPIGAVLAVPQPRPEQRVLQASGAKAFYIFNLITRTASPLTTTAEAQLHIAKDGQRLWAFERGKPNLASVSLSDLHPAAFPLDRPIDAVFDVARPQGGRSLVALDTRGAAGATVLDALTPDTASSRSYYGLLLEEGAMSKLGVFLVAWAMASICLEHPALADEQEAHALPALPIGEPGATAADEPPPPAPAMAPEAVKGVPPSARRVLQDDWRLSLGVRVGDIGAPAFDYFASNDTLAQVSMEGSYTLFRRGRFTASVGAAYDFGARSSGARGLKTRLAVHRLTVPIEAGYHVTQWLRVFAKVSPGTALLAARVEDPSAKGTLDHNPWLLAADASLGASVRLVNTSRARVWFTPEMGYGITSNRTLRVGPDRMEADVLGTDQSTTLGSIGLNGVFWRASLAVTF